MKLPCFVVSDLLPLYVEDMDCEKTHILIDEHISDCVSCKNELSAMRSTESIPMNTDVVPFRKIRQSLRKKSILIFAASIVLTLVALIIFIGYATTPQFIPYDNKMLELFEDDHGVVWIDFKNQMADYSMDSYYSSELQGFVYHISTYNTVWSDVLDKNTAWTVPLNLDGQQIHSVYYMPNDGFEDVLIYGNGIADGTEIALPRLVLAYYVIIAIIAAVTLGMVILILRKKPKAMTVLLKIEYLFIAYFAAHFCIMGFDSRSYSLAHDLFTILMLSIPLYVLCLIVESIIKKCILFKK